MFPCTYDQCRNTCLKVLPFRTRFLADFSFEFKSVGPPRQASARFRPLTFQSAPIPQAMDVNDWLESELGLARAESNPWKNCCPRHLKSAFPVVCRSRKVAQRPTREHIAEPPDRGLNASL